MTTPYLQEIDLNSTSPASTKPMLLSRKVELQLVDGSTLIAHYRHSFAHTSGLEILGVYHQSSVAAAPFDNQGPVPPAALVVDMRSIVDLINAEESTFKSLGDAIRKTIDKLEEDDPLEMGAQP